MTLHLYAGSPVNVAGLLGQLILRYLQGRLIRHVVQKHVTLSS